MSHYHILIQILIQISKVNHLIDILYLAKLKSFISFAYQLFWTSISHST